MRKAARALEEQGALVEEADPPLDARRETDPRDVVAGDGRPGRCRARRTRRAEIDPGLLAMAERGRRFSVGDYLAAYSARAELHNAMLRFHERYDLLLTPTMPITALKVGLVDAGRRRLRRRLDRTGRLTPIRST